jgi:hypothetical protein
MNFKKLFENNSKDLYMRIHINLLMLLFSRPKSKNSNISSDTYHIILYGHIPLNEYYSLNFCWR